jgi:hypothetical protein
MFLCHQHFLPGNHRFWKQIKEFRKGVVVTQGPPKRLTTAEIAEWHNRLAPKGDGFAGFAKEHNSTHIPGSWELPYATSPFPSVSKLNCPVASPPSFPLCN